MIFINTTALKNWPFEEPETKCGEPMAMWKTSKKKKSDFVESFVQPTEAGPDASGPGSEEPNWDTPSTEAAPSFTQDFFQDSHHPHQEDENTSLRVLGI